MDENIQEILEKTELLQQAPLGEPERQYYFIAKTRQYLKEERERVGHPLVACIKTFGCQMNARDSEKLTAILELVGFQISEQEEADFVIYNTCTVRENANNKVYGRLGYLSTYKKKHPTMKIALCGCMMQEQKVIDKIKTSYRFVDLIFGTHNIYKFAELLYLVYEGSQMLIDVWEKTDQIVEELPAERKYFFKSGINIMFGCNNFCSYCIVPYVRGRERSRAAKDILAEIKRLVQDGVVEIMLLGQNVNSYGRNLAEPLSFAELLKQIEQIDGLERIRFMTSHPKDLSDDLIEVMANSKKICRHLHLPLQSGSSIILEKMNRRYTKEQYLALVAKIREKMPELALTTDIIVGFPGETEADFDETMDVIKTVGFDSAFTFIYSKRTGTPAATMEEQVSEEVIKTRFDKMLKLIQKISAQKAQRLVGQTRTVLVEEVNPQDQSLLTGRLSNNSIVHFAGTAELVGTIVSIKLMECKGFYYMGHLI